MHMCYIWKTNGSTKKLLEFMRDLGKVAPYKINTIKSIAFVYTDNAMTEKELT